MVNMGDSQITSNYLLNYGIENVLEHHQSYTGGPQIARILGPRTIVLLEKSC